MIRAGRRARGRTSYSLQYLEAVDDESNKIFPIVCNTYLASRGGEEGGDNNCFAAAGLTRGGGGRVYTRLLFQLALSLYRI